jgi:hypothetical protein
VLPFRNITPIYNQYKEDFWSDDALKIQSKPLRSQFGKLFSMYSNQLNIRVTRDTGDFLSCTVCDAYDACIWSAHSDEHRAILIRFQEEASNKAENTAAQVLQAQEEGQE